MQVFEIYVGLGVWLVELSCLICMCFFPRAGVKNLQKLLSGETDSKRAHKEIGFLASKANRLAAATGCTWGGIIESERQVVLRRGEVGMTNRQEPGVSTMDMLILLVGSASFSYSSRSAFACSLLKSFLERAWAPDDETNVFDEHINDLEENAGGCPYNNDEYGLCWHVKGQPPDPGEDPGA